jgi:hypothetical protein
MPVLQGNDPGSYAILERGCLRNATERAGTKQLSEVKGFNSTTACTNGATPGGIDAPLTMNISLALHKAASCAPTQFA